MKYFILGHSNPDVDSIVSGILMEKLLKDDVDNVKFIIPDKEIDDNTREILGNYGINVDDYLGDIEAGKYILVDHHQDDRINEDDVIAVYDHHPYDDRSDIELYLNEDVSSTASLICQNDEAMFSKKDIELAVLATYVDTVAFHSTRSKDDDYTWCLNMINKYNIDEDKLINNSITYTDLEQENVAFNGFKAYNYKDKNIESSYLQVHHDEDITKYVDILNDYFKEKDLDYYVFIVHDMDEFKTVVYLYHGGSIIKMRYDEYTSRGSTIIPEVFELIDNENKKTI